MLSKEQQIQEDEYKIPYHWFEDRSNDRGRLYFGYLDLCLSFLEHKDLKSLKILDAGCGDGRFLGYMIEKGATPENLSGVDYSGRAVNFGRNILPKVTFSVSDITESLPFEDDSFDVVTLVETLEHIIPAKIDGLLINVKRVLKKGGVVIISTPSDVLPYGSKDYQYFSDVSLSAYLKPHFGNIKVIGQDSMRFHFLKIVYRLLDNKFWLIKPLARYYNVNIWAKYFNCGKIGESRRVVAQASKVA